MANIKDHDAYIDAAPEEFQTLLANLRAELAKALPDAEQIIAYNMPGFRIGKSIIAGYAAFTKQCGLYLAPGAISAHAEDIASNGLKSTKTGITFSVKKPIPNDLIEVLAKTSRKELDV